MSVIQILLSQILSQLHPCLLSNQEVIAFIFKMSGESIISHCEGDSLSYHEL